MESRHALLSSRFGNDGAVAEQTLADVMGFLGLLEPEREHDERHPNNYSPPWIL